MLPFLVSVFSLVTFAEAMSLQRCAKFGLMRVLRHDPYNITCQHDSTTKKVSWTFYSLKEIPPNNSHTIAEECVLVSRAATTEDYCDSKESAFRIGRPSYAYTSLIIDWDNVTPALTYGHIACSFDGKEAGSCFLLLLPNETTPASPKTLVDSSTPITETSEPLFQSKKETTSDATAQSTVSAANGGKALGWKQQNRVSMAAIIGSSVAVVTVVPAVIVGVFVFLRWQRGKVSGSVSKYEGTLFSDDVGASTSRSYPSTIRLSTPPGPRRIFQRHPSPHDPYILATVHDPSASLNPGTLATHHDPSASLNPGTLATHQDPSASLNPDTMATHQDQSASLKSDRSNPATAHERKQRTSSNRTSLPENEENGVSPKSGGSKQETVIAVPSKTDNHSLD